MSTSTLQAHPTDLRSAFRRAAASTWVVTGARAPDLDPVGFAGDRAGRFPADGSWGWADGLPEVRGAALRLVTTVIDLLDAGDSHLAIARVERATAGETAYPLIHHAGRFAPLTQIGA